MDLSLGQRRVLAKTEKAMRVCDPRLASLMDMFAWLNRAEEMPPNEQLPARARQRRGRATRKGQAQPSPGAQADPGAART